MESRRSRNRPGQVASVLLLVLAFLLCSAAAQDEPSVSALVSGHNLTFLETGNDTYALRPHTAMAGEALLSGYFNPQPSLAACAAACNSNAGCTAGAAAACARCSAFYYCDLRGACLVDPTGNTAPAGACFLLVPALALSIGVYKIASGPQYGTSGLKMQIPNPGPVPGFREFYGTTFFYIADYDCADTFAAGKCILFQSLQEGAARCAADELCDAIVFAPRGMPSAGLPTPFVVYKSWARSGSPGTRFNMSSSALLTAGYTAYVKEGRLALEGRSAGNTSSPASGDPFSAAASSGSSGLSAGTIAGIVVGATVGAAALLALVAVTVFWRRRNWRRSNSGGRRSCSSDNDAELGGIKDGCCLADDPTQLSATHHSGSGHTAQSGSRGSIILSSPATDTEAALTSGGFQKWDDVLIDRQAVELCCGDEGKPVRLGSGASGSVFLATVHGTRCACKVFDFGDTPRAQEHFVSEARLLWQLSHPSIVQCLGASATEEQGFLLMELMQGGTLHSKMHAEAPGGAGRLFAFHNRGRRVALQVASGLAYLHRHRCVHLDLKPRNVMLTLSGDAKIGDVGFSKIMAGDRLSSLGSRIGTWDWCAPEVLLGQPASESADIYSYGVLLWELCTGELPQRGFLRRLQAPEDCPRDVVELQLRCTLANPKQRPTAQELVEALLAHNRHKKAIAVTALGVRGSPEGSQEGEGGGGSSPRRQAQEPQQAQRRVCEPHLERPLRTVVLQGCTFPSPLQMAAAAEAAAAVGPASPAVAAPLQPEIVPASSAGNSGASAAAGAAPQQPQARAQEQE